MAVINTVFVSSTLSDLKEERSALRDGLLKVGCLPVGMEDFPASGTNKWAYIKDLISECDFYSLILGVRYGSTFERRGKIISYTEWEFREALKLKKPVLAFMPLKPDYTDKNKIDVEKKLKSNLDEFKNLVEKNNTLLGYYKDSAHLKELVISSFGKNGYLNKPRSAYSGIWVSEIPEVIYNGTTYEKKSDEWTFFGRENYIYGTIKRLIPATDKRGWTFSGWVFNDQILISFSENDIAKRSAGVMLVRKDVTKGHWIEGFYYEFGKPDKDGKPIPIPIILRKKV